MIDINTIITQAINAAITDAVAAAIAPLTDRIAALETKLAEASLFTQTTNVTVPVDEARMVEALNSQEWFWEKLQRRIDDAAEKAMDNHCSTYDHDDYDRVSSRVDELDDIDPDDFVTHDRVREEIEDVLNNATISLSI